MKYNRKCDLECDTDTYTHHNKNGCWPKTLSWGNKDALGGLKPQDAACKCHWKCQVMAELRACKCHRKGYVINGRVE